MKLIPINLKWSIAMIATTNRPIIYYDHFYQSSGFFYVFWAGFRISHILTGGSGPFRFGSTWKCIRILNVKADSVIRERIITKLGNKTWKKISLIWQIRKPDSGHSLREPVGFPVAMCTDYVIFSTHFAFSAFKI